MNKGKKISRARIGYVKSNHLNLILFSFMTKTRLALDSYTLLELKSQIALKLCFSVNGIPDCTKLSEVLLKEGYGSISVTTLYRLFVNHSGINPYKHTLNILVNYIGYSSWNAFLDKIQDTNALNGKVINKHNTPEQGLLYQCIALNAEKPLFAYFDSLTDREDHFKSMIALDVFDCLLKVNNPEFFFSSFVTNKFVKEYVLENAFDPAFRIKNYEHAFKLHLNKFSKVNSPASFQDFVFYHSVLFRYYYLRKDTKEAFAIGNEIYSAISFESEYLERIYIFPKIRFKAYKLWYLLLIGESKHTIEDHIKALLFYAKTIYSTIESYERRIVFHSIAEVFCYSGVNIKHHELLKDIFKNEFDTFPVHLFEKSIKTALPYFEPNGLLHYRPLR
jgi:hypothetical protein